MQFFKRHIKWFTNLFVLGLFIAGAYYIKYDTVTHSEVVGFTIQGKWAKGYSGKHSAGEYLYFRLCSEKYDRCVDRNNIHPLDWEENNVGDYIAYKVDNRTLESKPFTLLTFILILMTGSYIAFRLVELVCWMMGEKPNKYF